MMGSESPIERKPIGIFEISRFIIVRDVFMLFGKVINIPKDQYIVRYHSILQLTIRGQSPFTDIPLPEVQVEDHKIHSLAISNRNNFKIEKYKPSKHGLLYKESQFYLKKFRVENTEFRVTDLITLKLENRKTEIYINNRRFKQCKFLLLNLEKGKSYKKIESIDEASKILSKKMEHDHNVIPPETEFWGHCSNIQAWVENDYDLRLIHTNLGFPLLYELIKCGDKKALICFKEEIAYRIEKGGYSAWQGSKYSHRFFTDEEKEAIQGFKEYSLKDSIGRLEYDLNLIFKMKNKDLEGRFP